MNTFFSRYLIGSCAYGFVRKIDDLTNATLVVHDEFNYKEKHVIPMLLTDKVFVLAASTIASPYLLPFYLKNDLSLLEITYVRRGDPMMYGYKPKTILLDYMFS